MHEGRAHAGSEMRQSDMQSCLLKGHVLLVALLDEVGDCIGHRALFIDARRVLQTAANRSATCKSGTKPVCNDCHHLRDETC